MSSSEQWTTPEVGAGRARELLEVRTATAAWAIDAGAVVRIDAERSAGSPPVDVARALALVEGPAESRRILVVATPRGPLRLFASGTIGVRTSPETALLRLPAALWSCKSPALVAEVVVVDGAVDVLVVSVFALAERYAASMKAPMGEMHD